MKVKGISWIGVLTDDYEGTRAFWGKLLGLDQEWRDAEKGNTFFRFPSGQEVEVYSAANRIRKEKYQHFKGPVLGIEVERIAEVRSEMMAQGFEFITEVETTEDGHVSWAYFFGPDGFYIPFTSILSRTFTQAPGSAGHTIRICEREALDERL